MPRKKTQPSAEAAPEPQQASTAVAEPAAASASAANAEEVANAPTDGSGKNYGPPYKAVFTSNDKGFELGENRRFKQRVFIFKEKPAQDVIDKLKEHGFTYRPAEKAWTVEATAESRVLTDRLARDLAGPSQGITGP